MASLVADYSSDEESDDDCGVDRETPTVQFAKSIIPEVVEPLTTQNGQSLTTAVTESSSVLATEFLTTENSEPFTTGSLTTADSDIVRAKNFLICDANDESDSGGEADNSSTSAIGAKLNMSLEKLPSPQLGKMKKKKKTFVKKLTEGSVFTNQYEKAEIAKQSILEKHVKMTEKQDISGKKGKICKKFRQGNCRFEKNCKYSHDLDASLSLRYLQQDETSSEKISGAEYGNNVGRSNFPKLPPPPKSQGFMGTVNTLNVGRRPQYSHQQQAHFRQQERQMQQNFNEDDDDKFVAGDKRKKRVGLSQSLVPPKKAMAALTKQRVEERPWTLDQQ